MALFKILRGKGTDLSGVSKVDGHAYFCWDDGTFWIDYKESNTATEVKRKQINKDDWTADITEAIDALKEELQSQITGGVDYLGTVSSFAGLASFSNAGAGDFCRVSAEFTFGTETAKVGDLLIAIQNNPTNSILHWDLLRTEYDWTHTHNYTVSGNTGNNSGTAVAAITSISSTASAPGVNTANAAPQGHTHKVTAAGTVTAPTLNHTSTNTGTNSDSVGVVTSAVMPTFTVDKTNQKLIIKFGSVSTGSAAKHTHTHTYDKATSTNAPTFTGTEVTSKSNSGTQVAAVTSVSAPTISHTTDTKNAAPHTHTHSVSIGGTTTQPK